MDITEEQLKSIIRSNLVSYDLKPEQIQEIVEHLYTDIAGLIWEVAK